MSAIPSGARVTVMGLGLFGGGVATARYLAKIGADVLVTDLRDASSLRESILALEGLPIRYHLGEHREQDFTNTDFIVANPAVSPNSLYLTIARNHGVKITSELDLFLHACPSRDIYAITGTNGKTTTTTLASEILKLSKPRLFTGGNIGKSLLDSLDELQQNDTVLLEVSSFQLEALDPPRPWPRASLVTNISPDHLDRHGAMEDYVAAKRRIVKFQDEDGAAILNANDPSTPGFINTTKARPIFFSRVKKDAHYTIQDCAGIPFLTENLDGVEVYLSPLSALQLPGSFHIDNALAAAAIARRAGAPPEAVERAISQFRGVAHRLQSAGIVRNIKFYDNAVSTVPESTISALESIAPPIRWIAGGKSKGLDLKDLARAARERAVQTYLYGDAARELASALDAAGAPSRIFTNLSRAFEAASADARAGETILYSPAFPSFDQYRNYKERGAEFLKLVNAFREAPPATGAANAG